MSDDSGASPNERLLAAAREDNVDMLTEVLEKPESFDINYRDGLGNTALHIAVSHLSVDVLDELLSQEGCDVDLTNRLEGATPLHLAAKLEEAEPRAFIVDSLLEAGADPRIRDKEGSLAIDYVPEGDKETRNAFRRHQAQNSISKDDIANDDDDDEGSGSGSESD
ncbi:ankyrin repeat-containing domain protein [Gloeopeniophorella convolvens]|nr:ankyrin repeat-containing domain protein [Gloeopeniophorella convolvens]